VLSDLSLEKLKRELEEVKERAAFFDEFNSKLLELEKRTSTARMNLELAGISSDGSLSPEEKKKREFSVREKYAAADASLEDKGRANKIESAERVASEAAAVVTKAEAGIDDLLRQLNAATQSLAASERMKAEITQDRLTAMGVGMMESPTADAAARGAEATMRIGRNKAALSGLPSTEKSGEEIVSLIERLKESGKALEAFQRAASAASEKLDHERAISSLDDSNLGIVRGVERNARRAAAGIPAAPSRSGASADVIGGGIYIGRDTGAGA